MRYFTILLTCLTLWTLFNCSSPVTNNTTNSYNVNTDGIEVVLDSGVLVSASAIKTIPFSARKGFSYVTNIDYSRSYPGYNIEISAVSPSGDTLKNAHVFRAVENGVYTISLYVVSVDYNFTGDIAYCVEIMEYEPMPDIYNGYWLIVERSVSILGDSMLYNYSIDSASKVMGIRNDSTWTESYNSTIPSYRLAATTRFWQHSIELRNDTLMFSNSIDPYFSEKTTFIRLGTPAEVNWKENYPVIVPQSLIGTWYLSYDYYLEREFGHEESEEWSRDTFFNSGTESPKIIRITADSIEVVERIIWEDKRFSPLHTYTEPQFRSFIEYSQLHNGKIRYDLMEGESTKEDWFGARMINEYLPYTGSFPPQ